MLGWFSPKCPVQPVVKDWVEDRLSWLVDRLGEDTLRSAADATAQSLDLANYNPTEADARALFERVCAGMNLPQDAVRLRFDDDPADESAAASRDSGSEMLMDTKLTTQPEPLVAAFARGLAGEILRSRSAISPDSVEHGMVTELTTVFFGFGLFGANTAITLGSPPIGDGEAQTYCLPPEAWAYALAVRAATCDRDISGLLHWSQPPVKRLIQKSSRFLAKTKSPFTWQTDFLPDEQRAELCRLMAPAPVISADYPESTDEADHELPADQEHADPWAADESPELLDTDADWEPEATVMLLEAHELAKGNQHTEALQLLEQVIALEDDNEVAWQQQSASLSALGHHREAIAAAQRAVDLEPDDLQSLYSRGAALVRGDRGEEGLADLEQCIAQTTGSTMGALTFKSRCWWLRGLGELSMNQDEQARSSFQQAIRCWRDWPEPHEALAGLCERHGDLQQAEEHRAQARRRQG